MENIKTIIRFMNEKDVPQIVNLSEQLGYSSSVEEIKNRWLSISLSNSEFVFVLTLESDLVIGFAHVGIELGLTNSSRAFLRSFVIDLNHRSMGLGSNFLLRVEAELKKRGFSKIRLGSRAHRTDAHRFYQRMGYGLLKVWNVFEKTF